MFIQGATFIPDPRVGFKTVNRESMANCFFIVRSYKNIKFFFKRKFPYLDWGKFFF